VRLALLRIAFPGVKCYRNTRAFVNGNIPHRMWSVKKMSMVTAAKALPGRDQPIILKGGHYVLKNPIQPPFPAHLETCVFGTGCYWGTEKGFWRLPGVYATAVGYTGGFTKNPTYEEVCSGATGHNEAVLIVFDPKVISFVDVLHMFWISHDPTQGMGQGNDRGTQYRSGIYVTNAEQRKIAEASLAAFQKALSSRGFGTITTEIVGPPSVPFYYAEEYHQQYLAKPASRQYCSAQPTETPFPDSESWLPTDTPNRENKLAKLPPRFWAQHGPKQGCTIEFPNEQVDWV